MRNIPFFYPQARKFLPAPLVCQLDKIREIRFAVRYHICPSAIEIQPVAGFQPFFAEYLQIVEIYPAIAC
jgi:hypothetical protein